MDETEFTTLPLDKKWLHLKLTMDYVVKMDSVYSLRRRFNPHHPADQVKGETRNLRADQYQRWGHIKALYCAHRDELNDTLGVQDYTDAKVLFEKIFNMEVDDALRDIIGEE